MMRYAEVSNHTVTNVVVCDNPAVAGAQGWVACPDNVGPGYSYDGTTWAPPPEPGSDPLAQASAAQVADIPRKHENAVTLEQTLSTLTPEALTPDQTLALLQQIATGLRQTAEGFWVTSTQLGLRDDLPPAT